MRYLFVIATIVFCSLLPARGQRLFAKVDPTSVAPDLRFDVNDLPLVRKIKENDLNFSPNVLFAPDGSKAFVSYPGSDKVVAFDPRTGAVLALIQVGTNPTLISLAPDGKKIAVPSLFFADNLPQSGSSQGKLIGSISVIDIDTLSVTTVSLNNVFLSFANNVVFSADGKTGFVASSGTDEILRFDVETVSEISPRLKLNGGSRPSAITMAADSSFFAVVLVGSPFLDAQAVPDSIEIIDTASFSIRRTIIPSTDEGQRAHDFVALNAVSLSPDGKTGLIGDQENSSSQAIPAAGRDHAILFDVETGEVIETLFSGGVSTLSFLTPDQKSFVVMGQLQLGLVSLEEQTLTLFTPIVSNFNLTTRPAFLGDGRMFVAAPLDDQLLLLDLESGVFRRSVDVGGPVELQEGEATFTVSSAPLDLAFSPDETILTAVNFNANTVDLFQLTTRFFIPHLLSDETWFTGLAVTNNSASEAEIILKGIDTLGSAFQDDAETESVEFVNPVTIRLGAGKQTAFTAQGLLEASSSFQGWFESDTDVAEVSSFFMSGDRLTRRLDGALAVLAPDPLVILPEVHVSDGFRTEISVANPNFNLANIKIEVFSHEGTKLDERERVLTNGQILTNFLRDSDPNDELEDGFFPNDLFQDFVNGYVKVTSPEGIIALERYFDSQRLAVLNGIVPSLDTTLYLPQVAAFAGSETFLNLVHAGTEKATVNLALKSNQGTDLAVPVVLEVEEGQAVRTSIVPLFGLADPGSAVGGWVLINSDRPGLVVDAEIRTFQGKAMTTIPAQGKLLKRFVFSHVAEALGLSTGVALINPGGAVADVQVEVFDRQGSLVASRQFSLAPGNRETDLLERWFVNFPPLSGGYIKVSSTEGILGLELFFADNEELMSAVPAQEMP